MANKFPLIFNTSAGQIQELAANDNLDMSSSGVINASQIGIETTSPTSKLQVVGDVLVSGVVTATTFVGSLTGTATGVTADSVGLGTHTYGDYVKNITGTSNQITVTSGTGEGSTPTLSVPNQFTAPQDVTITRDLQVNRDLNVNGNITIGGTSATLFTTELKISDPDLVLGFRTDANNNDVSTDNTANHGGVAVASTEGTPLVDLFIAGIETNPATYKKIMWFKSGTFSGLGTDAWLSNYAVGIGSTQFPEGTRLASGTVQFTENDLAVVGNINASGVITATSLSSTNGTITNLTGTNANLSGVITATSYRGDGSLLTGVSAGLNLRQAGSTIVGGGATTINFASGATITNVTAGIATITIAAGLQTEAATPSNAIVTLDLSKQDHKITATGICTITCSGGTEGDSHTVRIVNSGIATVGFSTFFLFPSGSVPVLPTTSGAISIISFTVHRVGTAGTQLLAGASLNFS